MTRITSPGKTVPRPATTGTPPLKSRRWLRVAAGVTAALGASAVVNLLRARAVEAAHPPRGRFVTVDGVRVHYLEHGQGEPLVLIHGNGSYADEFELSGIVEPLARRHRVIIFDRPGCGYTGRPRGKAWTPEAQAELLLAAASQLGIDRPIVVGHSWGTLVALAWALDHPGRISRLVLLSGYYYPTTRADVAMFAVNSVPGVKDVVATAVFPVTGKLMTPLGVLQIFHPAKATQPFLDGFSFEMALRPSQLRATIDDTAQMHDAAARLSPRFGELALPITIVHGDGDKLVGCEAHAERLAAELPGIQLVIVPEAGHMVHHIAPSMVVDAILAAGGDGYGHDTGASTAGNAGTSITRVSVTGVADPVAGF